MVRPVMLELAYLATTAPVQSVADHVFTLCTFFFSKLLIMPTILRLGRQCCSEIGKALARCSIHST